MAGLVRFQENQLMALEIALFIAAGLAVSAGCLVPNRWLPSLPNDKLMHAVAFAVLSALALQLTTGTTQAALALAGLMLAGWAIECLQQLVPDRQFSWRDIAANGAGIVFVAACAVVRARW
jgi:hypothetical protein